MSNTDEQTQRKTLGAMRYLFSCRALLHRGEETYFFEFAGKICGEGSSIDEAALAAAEFIREGRAR